MYTCLTLQLLSQYGVPLDNWQNDEGLVKLLIK